ncbi:564_t:CDS:1, partial [Racocetra fulgida]
MSTFRVPDFPPLAYKPYNPNSNNDDRILTTSEDSEYSARIHSSLDDFIYSEEITVHKSTKNFEQVTHVNSQKQLVRGNSVKKPQQLDKLEYANIYNSRKPSASNDDVLSLYCEETVSERKHEALTRMNSQRKLARGDSARKLRQLDKISSENDYDSSIVERRPTTIYSVSNSEASEEITLHRNASLRKLEAVTRVNSQRKLERGYSTRKLKQLDSFGPENDYDSSVTGGQLVTNYPYDTFNSEEIAFNRNTSLRKLGTANYQRKLASDSFKELQQPDQNRSTNAHNSIKRPVTAYEQFQS